MSICSGCLCWLRRELSRTQEIGYIPPYIYVLSPTFGGDYFATF